MIVTRLAVALGVVVFGFLCYLAFAGSAPATGLVVTAVALVVLVGGGNWLGGRTTLHRVPPGPPSSRFYGVDPPDGAVGPSPATESPVPNRPTTEGRAPGPGGGAVSGEPGPPTPASGDPPSASDVGA